MKMLLSVSDLFYEKNINEIFSYIKKYDTKQIVGGMELNITSIDKNKYEQIQKIIYKLKENDMAMQIHAADLSKDMATNYEFLELYNKIANIYQEELNITYHPFEYVENIQDAIYKSNIVLDKMEKYITGNKYNIKICLENLDNVRNRKRLKLKDIEEIVEHVDNTYITYDIGHELVENICTYSVPTKIESKIKNIHIHDIDGFHTHHPFMQGSIDLDRTFSYLKWIDYSGNIVLEIAMEYFNNSSFEFKIRDYIEEFNKVNRYLKKYNLN